MSDFSNVITPRIRLLTAMWGVGWLGLYEACFYTACRIADIPYRFPWASSLIIVVALVFIAVVFFLNTMRNRYIIKDNKLLIKEYIFFQKSLDIELPLSTIQNPVLKRSLFKPVKHLYIEVGENAYRLSSLTYRQELFEYLQQHNDTEEHQTRETLFYKQTKPQKK